MNLCLTNFPLVSPASAGTSVKADHTVQDCLLHTCLSHEITRPQTAGISFTPPFSSTPHQESPLSVNSRSAKTELD